MRRSIHKTIYHRALRVSLLVCALVLVFDSGLLIDSTRQLSSGAQDYVASAVGVRVGVAPNDMNVLTTRITELENELAVAQSDRQIAVALNTDGAGASGMDSSTLVLSIILFILLVLISINYFLDYTRYRKAGYRLEEVSI